MGIEDLNIPVEIANAINNALSAVGISLPLYVTQLFLLLLSLTAFIYGIKRLRIEGTKDLVGILVTVAFGLMSAGVAFSWVEAAVNPLSGEVTGQVKISDVTGAPPLTSVTVALLDFHGENVARERGIVDSRTGYFALTYAPVWGDRPRVLRITAPGCVPHDVPLDRVRLRMGSSLLIYYRCQGGR